MSKLMGTSAQKCRGEEARITPTIVTSEAWPQAGPSPSKGLKQRDAANPAQIDFSANSG
jgi:hypothetical protein